MLIARTQRDRLVMQVIALCCLVVSACWPAPSRPISATPKPPVIQPTRWPSSPPTATWLSLGTPQPIDAALVVVTRAPRADDATALTSLMADQILLARGPEATIGGLIGRSEAIEWLKARWTSRAEVVASDYIDHDALSGQWRIDAILYQ